MSVRGQARNTVSVSKTTPAIGALPIENADRVMVTQGSADLFAAIVKYHVGQGRKEWEIFQ